MSANPWLSGQYAPVHDELDAHGLSVSGSLPPGLRGAFLRNGANPAFPPLGRYHIFDGDGMVHGLTFDGEGGASYRNRWVRTPGLLAEQAAGEALFGGLSEFRMPPPDVMASVGPMKNTANTHVVGHAGRILALMEGAKPVELTAGLDTVGEFDFDGRLAGPMTAHPKHDPVTGELVFFGYGLRPPYLRVHTADAAGNLTWSTEVELPGPVMMHDFVVTETKVVIFDLPAVFDLDAMLGGGEGIRWEPDHGARIGVLERGAPGDTVTWTEVEPFWVFHFLNGHDDGEGVVVTGCRAARLNTSFGEQGLTEPVHPFLHRWRIDPVAGVVKDEPLGDQPVDFPRVDERHETRDAAVGYVGCTRLWNEAEAEFHGVIRHDLRTDTSVQATYGPDATSGEPVFAPDLDADDDETGYVLNWVHDRSADESSVVVLDGTTLDEVARVHLPRRVPAGFHGSFLPA
jgi:carotenoid cleavage dioxygenase-like enzyme